MIALEVCPFCGGEASFSGDNCVICGDCKAQVIDYKFSGMEAIAAIWNKRSLNLSPLISMASKNQKHSAYEDLCSANFKLNNGARSNLYIPISRDYVKDIIGLCSEDCSIEALINLEYIGKKLKELLK